MPRCTKKSPVSTQNYEQLARSPFRVKCPTITHRPLLAAEDVVAAEFPRLLLSLAACAGVDLGAALAGALATVSAGAALGSALGAALSIPCLAVCFLA